jgi:hypothetical protein
MTTAWDAWVGQAADARPCAVQAALTVPARRRSTRVAFEKTEPSSAATASSRSARSVDRLEVDVSTDVSTERGVSVLARCRRAAADAADDDDASTPSSNPRSRCAPAAPDGAAHADKEDVGPPPACGESTGMRAPPWPTTARTMTDSTGTRAIPASVLRRMQRKEASEARAAGSAPRMVRETGTQRGGWLVEDGDGVCDGVRVEVRVAVPVALDDAVGDAVGSAVAVAADDDVEVCEAVALAVALEVGRADPVAELVAVAVADDVADEVADALADAVVAVLVAAALVEADGLVEEDADSVAVETAVTVEAADALASEDADADADSDELGVAESVGRDEGDADADADEVAVVVPEAAPVAVADVVEVAVAAEERVALAETVALAEPEADAVAVAVADAEAVGWPARTPVVKANAVPFFADESVPGAPTTARAPAASMAAAFPKTMLLTGTVSGKGMRMGMREKRAPKPVLLKKMPAGLRRPDAVMRASVPSGFRLTDAPKVSYVVPRASCWTHTKVSEEELRSKWTVKPSMAPPRGDPTSTVRPSALMASLSPYLAFCPTAVPHVGASSLGTHVLPRCTKAKLRPRVEKSPGAPTATVCPSPLSAMPYPK